ncbi:hypothetical protein [Sphingomonas sp. BK235]|jgi:hypothetical protein|uniref:hypothetical protein n=1 Tax=Sphingomonas sp. BK235 TaxID=2512131 RepID=UPI0010D5CFB7|nr:hypothetical protein [Sphingomonas sp. BK235]TCP34234.1 hypothetical protein EV292_104225 [Sphingomonas sp. BK235]
MKITYCRDVPKGFLCAREEEELPCVGDVVAFDGVRYLVRRAEHVGREGLVYVMPV